MVAICSDDRPFPVYASLLQAAYLVHVFLLGNDFETRRRESVQEAGRVYTKRHSTYLI
jgi:hypothetical protein